MTRKHKVCIVEDDPFLRLDAAELLEEAGFAVEQFTTADRALAYLQKHAAAVMMVFTDVRTPGTFDGLTLARTAAQHWPWIRLLITSGTIGVSDEGMPPRSTFLRKPWRPADLLAHAIAAEA